MRKVPAALLSACLTVAVTLAACSDTPKAENRAGVMLAGNWKLDHAASDDPQPLIARMRTEAQKIIRRQAAQAAAAALAASPRGGGVPPPDLSPQSGPDEPGGAAHGPRPDPLQHSPMMHLLSQVIARGEYLTVRQRSDELSLDFGTTQRSYTPGGRSVVSAEMGVADQTSGWHGHEFVINIKAQLGANVLERLSLSADGTRLIDKVRIGPAELPAI
ncbi:MAG TPA: hypothetical protein VGR80_04800, partial [Steroidobacteraceae bacterium]|nr:hypothetical protein [Steroidobacteraceae bacterium]